MVNWERNCLVLKENLKMKNNYVTKVEVTSINGIDYFKVKLAFNDCRSEMKICESLKIPRNKCHFVGYDKNGTQINYIVADALFEKYGEPLCFEKPFNFMDTIQNDCEVTPKMSSQLSKKDIKIDKVCYKKDNQIILLRGDHPSWKIARALEIHQEAVVDISCESDVYSHIIIIDRCM